MFLRESPCLALKFSDVCENKAVTEARPAAINRVRVIVFIFVSFRCYEISYDRYLLRLPIGGDSKEGSENYYARMRMLFI